MKRMLIAAAVGLALGGALAVGLAIRTHTVVPSVGATGPSQASPPSAQSNGGVRFTPVSVTAGTRATLPDGSQAIPRDQAVSAAMRETDAVTPNGLLPGVSITARYGIFSDDQLAKNLPSGGEQPLYQERPVWLVTFSGLNVPLDGGVPHPGQTQTGPRHPTAFHEENVVIDAAMGEYLETYAYR